MSWATVVVVVVAAAAAVVVVFSSFKEQTLDTKLQVRPKEDTRKLHMMFL